MPGSTAIDRRQRQPPEFAGVGAWDGYGYGEYQPAGSEPVGYFAEEQPMGYYGEDPNQPMGYYGQAPEMVGYGEPEFAEEYPGNGLLRRAGLFADMFAKLARLQSRLPTANQCKRV